MAEQAINERRAAGARRVKRRWSASAKLRIVEESNAAGRQVSKTARRHGVSPTLLFHWRKLAREGRLGADEGCSFAPAAIVPARDASIGSSVCSARAPGVMEIAVDGGRVTVDASVEREALVRVLAALRQATREELSR